MNLCGTRLGENISEIRTKHAQHNKILSPPFRVLYALCNSFELGFNSNSFL